MVETIQQNQRQAMAEEHKRIDVGGIPELLRIAEDVQRSRQPYVLQRGSEDVAVVVPVPTKPKRARREVSVEEAVLATAGSWKDLIDAEELKAQLAAERGSHRLLGSL